MQKTLISQRDYLSGHSRHYFETAANRIDLLEGTDKMLMRMLLLKGLTCYEIAQITGTHTGTLSRRINRLLAGLMNMEFAICRQNQNLFTQLELAIAKDYYVQGTAIKAIAAQRNLTIYQVSKTIKETSEKIQKIKENQK